MSHGPSNAGLIILRVTSERRDAQNESIGAGAAQLRRSSNSVAAAAPSQQHYNLNLALNGRLVVASLLEVLLAAPRGGTRRLRSRAVLAADETKPTA